MRWNYSLRIWRLSFAIFWPATNAARCSIRAAAAVWTWWPQNINGAGPAFVSGTPIVPGGRRPTSEVREDRAGHVARVAQPGDAIEHRGLMDHVHV